MREFFRGWRRMIGVVTLVMALVFAGIWIRSQHVVDTLTLRSEEGPRRFLAASRNGLTWGRKWGSGQYVEQPEFMNLSWETAGDAEPIFGYGNGWDIEWNWQCFGFQFGSYYLGNGLSLRMAGIAIWNIPHWSITIPLTALSAFLLLSRPRQSNQKKIPEPIVSEGTRIIGEFFKLWRRKLGVVTLVIACVAMAGWVQGNRILFRFESCDNSFEDIG